MLSPPSSPCTPSTWSNFAPKKFFDPNFFSFVFIDIHSPTEISVYFDRSLPSVRRYVLNPTDYGLRIPRIQAACFPQFISFLLPHTCRCSFPSLQSLLSLQSLQFVSSVYPILLLFPLGFQYRLSLLQLHITIVVSCHPPYLSYLLQPHPKSRLGPCTLSTLNLPVLRLSPFLENSTYDSVSLTLPLRQEHHLSSLTPS